MLDHENEQMLLESLDRIAKSLEDIAILMGDKLISDGTYSIPDKKQEQPGQ